MGRRRPTAEPTQVTSQDKSDAARQEQIARRRLVRLMDALPVFSGFCSPDGHLLQTWPATKETFLWSHPAFGYSHDSITDIVDQCERAANGERVQVERPYNEGFASGRALQEASLRRGLLTLTPVADEEGFVDELGFTLMDCEANGLAVRDERAASRLAEANARIASVLSLSQTVIETLSARSVRRRAMRDDIAARLDVLARTIDPLSQIDMETLDFDAVVTLALADRTRGIARGRFARQTQAGRVPLDFVPLFVLVLSELAANARRHGAWRTGKGASGRVTLQSEVLDTERGRVLRVHWVEDGGPEVPAILSTGFGLTLGARLFPQLTGGRASYLDSRDGLSWTFELPVGSEPDAEPEGFGTFDSGYGGDAA